MQVQNSAIHPQPLSASASVANQQNNDASPPALSNFSGRNVAICTGAVVAFSLAFSEGLYQTEKLAHSYPVGTRAHDYSIGIGSMITVLGSVLALPIGVFVGNQMYNITESIYGRICSALSKDESQGNSSAPVSHQVESENTNDKENDSKISSNDILSGSTENKALPGEVVSFTEKNKDA